MIPRSPRSPRRRPDVAAQSGDSSVWDTGVSIRVIESHGRRSCATGEAEKMLRALGITLHCQKSDLRNQTSSILLQSFLGPFSRQRHWENLVKSKCPAILGQVQSHRFPNAATALPMTDKRKRQQVRDGSFPLPNPAPQMMRDGKMSCQSNYRQAIRIQP